MCLRPSVWDDREEVMEEVGYRDASSFKYFDDLSVNVEINYPLGSGHG